MTDIYDFRDPMFTTYNKEWNIIFKGICKYIQMKQQTLPTLKFKKLFKRHIPNLWDTCPDDILHHFIMRSLQIGYHELVYIQSKESQ